MALVPIFFVMALGYIAVRWRTLDNRPVGELNALVMDFALPVATASTARRENVAAGTALGNSRRGHVADLPAVVRFPALGIDNVERRGGGAGSDGCHRGGFDPAFGVLAAADATRAKCLCSVST
jgi:hypothetical protein